jgi:predicted negative regulator of RcsB-dependent stress response
MASVETGRLDAARAQAEVVAEEFGSTAYSALAALVLARAELEAGNPDAARTALERAIAAAPEPAVAKVASLRLARVLISQGKLDEAAAVISTHAGKGSFEADFDALRGDIAVERGRIDEAREAYTRAIAGGAANAPLLRLKLDDLPKGSVAGLSQD